MQFTPSIKFHLGYQASLYGVLEGQKQLFDTQTKVYHNTQASSRTQALAATMLTEQDLHFCEKQRRLPSLITDEDIEFVLLKEAVLTSTQS